MSITSKFNENRTYGIEIEFVSADRELVAQLIRAKGVDCYSENYNHQVSHTTWKVITDASCGNELVSPILKGRDGLRQLKLVCEALHEAGAKVNKQCGLHVHHDCNDLTVKQIANVFAYYIRYEKSFDSLMPMSRRANNNMFCKSNSANYNSPQDILDRLKNAETLSSLSDIFNSRYVKLNYRSYIRYGTLEFRQHSGTIEFDKIYNWILLSQQVVEQSVKKNVRKTYKEANDTLQHLSDAFGMIRSEGADDELADMFKWYKKRAKSLVKVVRTPIDYDYSYAQAC